MWAFSFSSSVAAPREDSRAEWSDATSPDWAPAPLRREEGAPTLPFFLRVSVLSPLIKKKNPQRTIRSLSTRENLFIELKCCAYLYAFTTSTLSSPRFLTINFSSIHCISLTLDWEENALPLIPLDNWAEGAETGIMTAERGEPPPLPNTHREVLMIRCFYI